MKDLIKDFGKAIREIVDLFKEGFDEKDNKDDKQ